MSYRIAKEIHFCYGHRLLNYQGKCRNLHGHNGKVEIELEAKKLDRRGMVLDFEKIKDTVKGWIDEHLDHKMLLHKKDPVIAALRKMKEPFYLLDENPTAENIAKLIYDYALSEGFPVRLVRLWETETSYAAYAG